MRGAAAAALLLIAAAPPASQGKIRAIEIRFFDPEKGEFKGDVLKDGFYSGRNTFMTEGNGGLVRGDALVLVQVELPDWSNRNFVIDGPLTITARNNGKIIARRRFTRIDLRDSNRVRRAIYLQDIGCTGEIVVNAELAGETKAARLVLGCGE